MAAPPPPRLQQPMRPPLAAPGGMALPAAAAAVGRTIRPAPLRAFLPSLCPRRAVATTPLRARQEPEPLRLGALANPYGHRDNVPVPKTDPELASMPIAVRPLLSDNIDVADSSKHEERCVLVTGLPFSIMPADVQAAAGPGLISSVQTVELLYAASGNFSGKAIVTLDSVQAAIQYAKQAIQAPVAGRHLTTEIMTMHRGKRIVLPSDPTASDVRRHNQLANASLFASFLTSRYGGRVVALRGLPEDFSVRRLYNMLWHGDWKLEPQRVNMEWNAVLTRLFHSVRRHDSLSKRGDRRALVEPVTQAMVRVSRDSGSRSRGIPLDQHTTTDGLINAGRLDPIFPHSMPGHKFAGPQMYLVVLASEAEAHRFVRRWHRQPFSPQEFGWQYILQARIMY